MINSINIVNKVNVKFLGNDTKNTKILLTNKPDTFEFNEEKDEKIKQRNKIIIIAASVLAAIVAGIAIFKRQGFQAIKKIKNGADDIASKGEDVISHSKSDVSTPKAPEHYNNLRDNVVPEKTVEQTKIKEEVKPKVDTADDLAKLKIAKLKTDYQEVLNKYGIDAKIDDEVFEIINKELKQGLFSDVLGYDFQLRSNLRDNPACVSDYLYKSADEVSDPIKKEELLFKSFNFFPKKKVNEHWVENVEPEKFETLYKEFRNLYKQNADFKSKQLFEDTIKPKFLNMFENQNSIKVLNEIFGSKCDYELYEKFLEKSLNYKKLRNPIAGYNLEYAKNDEKLKRKILLFLSETFPKLINVEKNPLKKEDMLMKFLNTTIIKANNQKNTAGAYDILCQLEALHEKGGAEFVHKDTVSKQLKELIDVYLGKFNIPLSSEKDKRLLADTVISSGNRQFLLYTPDDVKCLHIIRGLASLGDRTADEKYYRAAVEFAIQQNTRYVAINLIEKIKSNDKLSKLFKDDMINVQNNLKAELNKIFVDTVRMLNEKSLDDAFENIISNPSFKDVAAEAEKVFVLSSKDLINKMKEGDANIIKYVIKNLIDGNIFHAYNNVKSSLWDELVQYLSKVDEVVKDPQELEFLQNIKLHAIGAKFVSLRNTDPEQKVIYHNILKSEIISMLYGKGNAKDSLEKIKIDDSIIEDFAKKIEKMLWIEEPELSLYKVMKENLINHYSEYSAETQKIMKEKFIEIKNRLGITSQDDFFDEFSTNNFDDKTILKDRFKDILNKYLPQKQKLGDNVKSSDIKAAYRQLVIKYHPDKAKNPEEAKKFEEIFKEVSDAYEALK